MCSVILWNDIKFIYVFEIIKVLRRRSHWSSAETFQLKLYSGQKRVIKLLMLRKNIWAETNLQSSTEKCTILKIPEIV